MEHLHTVGHSLNFGQIRSYFALRSIYQVSKVIIGVQADHKIAHAGNCRLGHNHFVTQLLHPGGILVHGRNSHVVGDLMVRVHPLHHPSTWPEGVDHHVIHSMVALLALP